MSCNTLARRRKGQKWGGDQRAGNEISTRRSEQAGQIIRCKRPRQDEDKGSTL